jgi:2-hydroxychromene-2-carboxylate isomerase
MLRYAMRQVVQQRVRSKADFLKNGNPLNQLGWHGGARKPTVRHPRLSYMDSYMDCRRQARKRGLAIRGTTKIWDTVLAASGMLYAKRHGDAVFRAYHDRVFERFWKRELDVEDIAIVTAVLAEAGADIAGFAAYAAEEGPAEVQRIRRAAEAAGVFGTPTFVIDGELFWGSEHLPDIREMLSDS